MSGNWPTNMNRDSETGELKPKVSDKDILMAIRRDAAPVTTATGVADDLDMARTTILRRLEKLNDRGIVGRKQVGAKAVVWWEK